MQWSRWGSNPWPLGLESSTLPLSLQRCYSITVNPVLSSHSKKTLKLFFNTDCHLMQVKGIAECANRSILQYFRPSLSYNFRLRPLFCLQCIFKWPLKTGFTVFILWIHCFFMKRCVSCSETSWSGYTLFLKDVLFQKRYVHIPKACLNWLNILILLKKKKNSHI